MLLVDERVLHNKTIIRIGEEHDIYKLPGESELDYIIRIIKELQFPL